MAEQERISRVVVEDPHGNTIVDKEISTVERETVIAEHNASETAHPYIRGLVGAALSEAESKIEQIYVGDVSVVQTDQQGKKFVQFQKDQFGKVDGIRINNSQEDLPVDENGKVSIPIPTTVSELTDSDDYATKEYVTEHTPTTVAELTDANDYATKEYVADNTPTTVAELSDANDYATKAEAQAMVDEAKVESTSVEYEENGGSPNASVNLDDGDLHFTLQNLKMKFSELTPKEIEQITGPQGIAGEGAIWTGEGEKIMTLEQETGQAINKAMSQKAVTDELDSISQDIYDYEEDGETDTDLTSLITATDAGKMVNAPGGTLSNSSGQDASGYIDIEGYEAITYPRNSASTANPVWGIAFYDENKASKNQTGWYEKAIYNASATDYVAKRINVPEGAKYVRLSLRHTGFSTPTLTGHKTNYTKSSKIEKVEEQVNASATSIEAIDHEVYEYEKSGVEVAADLSPLITHNSVGYNVSSNGALASGSQINDSTDFIDIGDYDAIRYSHNSGSVNPMTWGIAFYAEDKSTLKGFEAAIIDSSATDYVITDKDVPEGAKYVRMTIRKTNQQGWSAPVLKGLMNTYTKSSKIEAIEQKIENVGKGIFPPLIGVPQPYIFTPTEEVVSNFEHVADLYAAYDALCTQYPKWLQRKNDIGTDATQTYEVRHYTLCYQTPLVSAYRDGSGTNYWSDEDMPMRRILLMTGIHALETLATRGTYMAVEAICKSNEPWAQFIKANAIIDIIPIINPWGLENKDTPNVNGNYNVNQVNLNRDYKSATPQVETQNVIDLIQDLLPLNLGGLIDMHNTITGDTYLVSNTAYKEYTYYARLAQQLCVTMAEPLASVFGSSGNHMHCWITDETGQGHWYADKVGILGVTCETKPVSQKLGRCSCLSAMQAVNAIIAFLQKIN